MVCLGNICRSPLAEGILRSKLPNNFTIDSAGTANYHIGHHPDKRSVQVASEHSIDISHLKGRQFSYKDFSEFDSIFVMDSENYKEVIKLAKTEEDQAKVALILNFIYPEENIKVPDPYYGDLEDFRKVYYLLDEVCEVIKEELLMDN